MQVFISQRFVSQGLPVIKITMVFLKSCLISTVWFFYALMYSYSKITKFVTLNCKRNIRSIFFNFYSCKLTQDGVVCSPHEVGGPGIVLAGQPENGWRGLCAYKFCQLHLVGLPYLVLEDGDDLLTTVKSIYFKCTKSRIQKTVTDLWTISIHHDQGVFTWIHPYLAPFENTGS